MSVVAAILSVVLGNPHPVATRDPEPPKPSVLQSTAPAPASFTYNAPSTQPGVLKVMVVGDSISQGKTGDDPWRCQLWRKLRTVMRVDMVGIRDDLAGGGDYANADCDTDHDAQWGSLDPLGGFLSTAKVTIAADVTTAKPDVMLVLLGINDINWAHPEATIETDFTELVTNARSSNPSLRIVAGTVMPTNGVVPQAPLDEYNTWLLANAASLGVTLVRTDLAIDPAVDLYDGVHPTTEGSGKIAKLFLPAILRR